MGIVIDFAEYVKRRARTERGVSPAQHTAKSENKARRAKRPGTNNRSAENRKAITASKEL